MDYTRYDVADFATDDLFISWVTQPSSETDRFWHTFLVNNPAQAETVNMARQIVQHLRQAEQTGTVEPAVDAIWKRLETNVHAPQPIRRLTSWWPYAVAASVLLVLGLGWWMNNRFNTTDTQTLSTTSPLLYPSLSVEMADVRTDKQPVTVRLGDGSTVELLAHSHLRYPKSFSRAQRDVFLTGEAFFEVARRPDQPFLVHSDALVTKVLGTSFRVRAYEADPTVTVDVRTGRVAVYLVAASAPDKASGQQMILVPNQKVVYERDKERLTKTLTEQPIPVAALPGSSALTFDEAPVTDVFKALERIYGITLVYNANVLNNCTITTSLTAEPLFNELQIVCKAIGASYHQEDGQIVIEGPGCH